MNDLHFLKEIMNTIIGSYRCGMSDLDGTHIILTSWSIWIRSDLPRVELMGEEGKSGVGYHEMVLCKECFGIA